ncbi:hypothetical protein [Tepidanaerobacter acetatoxydans]|nr:hypothetical protein [Tepidanaerobacter acetatoxydans]
MLDPYLFPDSEVLKNKLDIKEKDKLEIVEAEYTSLLIGAIAEENTIKGDFSFEHLCQMHCYIFRIYMNGPGNQE